VPSRSVGARSAFTIRAIRVWVLSLPWNPDNEQRLQRTFRTARQIATRRTGTHRVGTFPLSPNTLELK